MKTNTPPVMLAQVDSTKETNLASKFQISGYPTLKWFINGSDSEFTGGRDEAGIINWINKHVGPATSELKSLEELEKEKKEHPVVVLFLGKEGDSFEHLKQVAQEYDDIIFFHTFDQNIRKNFDLDEKEDIILFKQFDEGKAQCNCDLSKDNIKKFLEETRYPTVMNFDEKAAERIFGKGESCLVMFHHDKKEEEPTLQMYSQLAKEMKGEIIFTSSQVHEGLGKRLAEYVGQKEENTPAVWILDFKQRDLNKFQMKTSVTKEHIKEFVENWKGGKIEKHMKSQEIPEKNDGPVIVLKKKLLSLNCSRLQLQKTLNRL